jgi:hypothetical protein
MFNVGDMVVIESRTWPGINKPGGVGKVIDVKNSTIDVKYTLGGSEKNIEIIYAKIWDVDLTTSAASTARRGSTTTQACLTSKSSTIGKIPTNKRTSPQEDKKVRIEKKSSTKEEAKDIVKKHKAIAVIASKAAEGKTQLEKERSIPPKKNINNIKNISSKDEKENRLEQKVDSSAKDKGEQSKVYKANRQKCVARNIRAPSQDEQNDASKKSKSINVKSKVFSKSSPYSGSGMASSTNNLRDESNQRNNSHLDTLTKTSSESISRQLPIELETFIERTSRVMDGAYEMEIERFLQNINFSGEKKISEEDALRYFELMEDRNIVMFSSSLRTLYRIT